MAFASKGIDSWDKLKGKTIFNGPPRGGATTTAKAIIRMVTGMKEGDGYTAKHVSWPQANSIFLDGALRPQCDLVIILRLGFLFMKRQARSISSLYPKQFGRKGFPEVG